MSTLKTNNIQHVDRSDPSIIINTDGSVNIAGTMTYEDVTNVDAVGIITGRSNIDAQKQVLVGTGVSVKAGGLNVTAGITTVQALQATTGTFSGDVSIADKIIHTGDTNTAIRFPSADTFTVETGGSERFRIDSTGNTLIYGVLRKDNVSSSLAVTGGNAADSSANIVLHGSSGSPANVTQFRTGSTERMRISSDGKIGVGAASPSHLVHLQDATTPRLVVEDTTNNVQAQIGADNTEARIGTVSNHPVSFRVNDSEKARIDTNGKMGLGTNSPQRLLHLSSNNTVFALTDTAASTDQKTKYILTDAGAFAFGKLNDAYDTATEQFRIGNSGNIGINEQSPDTKLHVTAASGDTILTLQRSDSNTTGLTGGINFAASDDHSVASIQARGDGDNEGAELRFYTTSAAAGDMFNAANVERLRIASNGVITLGNPTNTVLQAEVCNAVSGHQFISQCSDNNNGFEVYQKHGSTSTRNTFAAYGNTGSSSSKKLQFAVVGDGNLKFDSGFGSAGIAYGCRAWVSIDNTSGNMHLAAGGNVSSVSDLGSGSGQVFFSNAMPNGNYAVVSGLRRAGIDDMVNTNFSNSTGNFRYDSFTNGGSNTADLQGYAFAVFR